VREQGAEAYDFSHGLLRQVAYGSLSAARRRLLHGRVVRALEAQRNSGRAVDDGQLAGHYVAIGRYSAAIASLQHAAMAAQRIFAHNEALANLEQASELSATAHSSEKDLLALHEQRADVLALIGHYAAAHEALDTALAHAADPLDQARLLHKQGKAWMAQHQRPAAMDAYDAALRALAPPPDPPDEQWLQMWLDVQLARGNIFYFDTRLEALAALIEQLDDIANSKGTVDQQRSYLELHNMLAISQKRYLLSAGDVAMRQRISALAEQTGDPHQVAASSFSLGFHYLWSGAVDQGIARLTTALAEATEIGNLYLQDQCLAYLALAYRVQGDTARVAAVVAQHRPISAQVGNPLYGGVLAANEAWLAVMAGDWDSAETHGRAALAMWKPLQYPIQWPALWPLLAVALVQNRLTEAIDYATQLLAPTQQLLDTDIADLLQQAIASCEDGDTAPAHAHLVHAIERVRANHTF
jgi:tetratricopeptide (TPR) repeat protein